MNELFVTDLDGTLLGADSRVSACSAAMLRDLTAHGALISVATARTPATVVPLLEDCGLTLPQVVMTGAALWDPVTGSYISMQYLDPATAIAVASVVADCRLHPLVYKLADDGRILHLFYSPSDMPADERKFVDDRSSLTLKKVHPVESVTPLVQTPSTVLILALGPAADVRRAADRLCGLADISVSHYNDPVYPGVEFLEVFGPDVSKASGLRRLKEMLHVSRITVFGDSDNDLPMMHTASRAVAVANAADHVKATADMVIGPNTDDSVARCIASLLRPGSND